jgi:DeoR/GlpR family transcriptional regulator of sugar metabolism
MPRLKYETPFYVCRFTFYDCHQYNSNRASISTGIFSSGLTTSDWDTFQVKKAMTGAASKLAVLTTSENLNLVMHMKIADVNKIDYLITELAPDSHELQAYKSQNINQ